MVAAATSGPDGAPRDRRVEIMYRKGMKRVGGLVLAAMLLAGAPAAAAGGQGNGGFLAWAWQWVQSLWAENGLCIDPNGAPCAPRPNADNGPHIDPNG